MELVKRMFATKKKQTTIESSRAAPSTGLQEKKLQRRLKRKRYLGDQRTDGPSAREAEGRESFKGDVPSVEIQRWKKAEKYP